MDIYLLLFTGLIILSLIQTVLLLNRRKNKESVHWELMKENMFRLEEEIRRGIRELREESLQKSKADREELNSTLLSFRKEISDQLSRFIQENRLSLEKGNSQIVASVGHLQSALEKNMEMFGIIQRERFNEMEKKQNALLTSTEKSLEEMRLTVNDKLQQTLNERITRSFEMVKSHLESVQTGLGEMKALASDVGGLKRVLSNVKTRGVFGEVQLRALLDQMLSPEQYEMNVKTRKNSNDLVEFAIKLPGKNDTSETVYLPIDAKFPKDVYENFINAQDSGDPIQIDTCSRQLEVTISNMAKDINNKYIDPPYTTDFAILFLPFENIYAEVIRRTALMEQLHRKYKITITGPTTLGAILNSLQMGFRTLAIQKRSSEVWQVLGAVKTEFGRFGEMLEKIQKNIQDAGNNLDKLVGTRTKMMMSKLRSIEALPSDEAASLFLSDEPNDTDADQSEI